MDKKYFKLIPNSLEINTFDSLRGNIISITSDEDLTGEAENTSMDLEDYINILKHMDLDKILEACNKPSYIDKVGIEKLSVNELIKNKTIAGILELKRNNSMHNICNNLAMLSDRALSVKLKGIGYAEVDSVDGMVWIYGNRIKELRNISKILKGVRKLSIECSDETEEIRIPEVQDSFYGEYVEIRLISDIEEGMVPKVIDINNTISDRVTKSVTLTVYEVEKIIANTDVGDITHLRIGCLRSKYTGVHKMKEIDLTNRRLGSKRIVQRNDCEHIKMNKCMFEDQLKFAKMAINARADIVEVIGCKIENYVDDSFVSEYIDEHDGEDKDIIIDKEGYRKIGKYLVLAGFKKIGIEDYARMINKLHKLGCERPEGLRKVAVIKGE